MLMADRNIWLWRATKGNQNIEDWDISKQYEPCYLGVKFDKLQHICDATSLEELTSRYEVETSKSSIAQAAWCMQEAKKDDMLIVFIEEDSSLYAIAYAFVAETLFYDETMEFPNVIELKNIVELSERLRFSLPNVGIPKSFMKKLFGSDAKNILSLLNIE